MVIIQRVCWGVLLEATLKVWGQCKITCAYQEMRCSTETLGGRLVNVEYSFVDI